MGEKLSEHRKLCVCSFTSCFTLPTRKPVPCELSAQEQGFVAVRCPLGLSFIHRGVWDYPSHTLACNDACSNLTSLLVSICTCLTPSLPWRPRQLIICRGPDCAASPSSSASFCLYHLKRPGVWPTDTGSNDTQRKPVARCLEQGRWRSFDYFFGTYIMLTASILAK